MSGAGRRRGSGCRRRSTAGALDGRSAPSRCARRRRTGCDGGAAGSGRVEDLVDDLALLQASAGLDAERLGHFQEGVLVLRFENRLFECRSGHGCSSLLAAMWSDQASDGVSGEGGRPMSPEDRSPERNSHTTENSGCGPDDRAPCTLATADRSMQRQRPTSCSMSRSTASRSLATSWVTSGRSNRSAR